MRIPGSNEARRAQQSTDRNAQIEAIRAAIADGSYQVDVDTLAERLVSEELTRWGKPSVGS